VVPFELMPLAVMPTAFDHPDWLWEVKYDGFRSLAIVEAGACRLVSRKQHQYKSFQSLAAAIATTFDRPVVLDGEIVCLDNQGRPQFYDLLWHRSEPLFYAFDVLRLDGRDVRGETLIKRKKILRDLVVPKQPGPVLYADFLVEHGTRLFEAVVARDLEGVVAKHKDGLYTPEATTWVKVKNPRYSQGEGRRELFAQRRGVASGFQYQP
jgi:bifunctional non-homologous end joining protein LigD